MENLYDPRECWSQRVNLCASTPEVNGKGTRDSMREKYKERWVPKHSVPMQVYEVYCPTCEITYHMEASELRELYCPLCENNEPIQAKEVKNER